MTLPDPVPVLGVTVHPITKAQLIDTLLEWAASEQSRRAYHVNAHALNLAEENSSFLRSLNTADLVYCDGFGARWAARALGIRLPERMTPPDWIDDFLSRLPSETSVFLLGDEQEVVSKCADLMSERHANLRIVGNHHGFFDIDAPNNRIVADTVNDSGASVLLVGMGMPRQELWIDANMDSLTLSLAISVGALFQYYVGVKRRAPRWMTDHGLEWLGRLFYDPAETFSRYVAGNPRLVARVLRERGGL